MHIIHFCLEFVPRILDLFGLNDVLILKREFGVVLPLEVYSSRGGVVPDALLLQLGSRQTVYSFTVLLLID